MLLNISSANDGNAAMMYESLPEEERLKSGGLVEYTAKVGKVYKAPGSIEGWTVFEGLREGEGILESLEGVGRLPGVAHRVNDVFSLATINKAPLTIDHLFFCSECLVGEGMVLQGERSRGKRSEASHNQKNAQTNTLHAALPLLIMAEFISHTCVPTANENLRSLCVVKIAQVLFGLGKVKEGLRRLGGCGKLGLDERRVKIYKEEVEQVSGGGSAKFKSEFGLHIIIITIIISQIELQKRGEAGSNAEKNATTKNTIANARQIKVKRFEARHLWSSLASSLVALEQPSVAITYLDEALRHCEAYNDYACKASCLVVKAKVALMSGDLDMAVRCCKMVLVTLERRGGGESGVWAEATLLISSAMGGPPGYGKGEVRGGGLERTRRTINETVTVTDLPNRKQPQLKSNTYCANIHCSNITLHYSNSLGLTLTAYRRLETCSRSARTAWRAGCGAVPR